MRKPLENLIDEFLEEFPNVYIRRDQVGGYEVGVVGDNHTHGDTIEDALRRYWSGVGHAEPACGL